MRNIIKKVAMGVGSIAVLLASILVPRGAFAADYAFSVAPMTQKIMLYPGEVFEGSFKISNPSDSEMATYYTIEIEPFYQDENGTMQFEAEGDMGQIEKWTTLATPAKGKLEPNEVKEVVFRINVPKDAPAGGQYEAISVTGSPISDDEKGNDNKDVTIQEKHRLAHLIYAEVTGATIRKGEIIDAGLSSFLLSGNITGTSSVKNAGNVHGDAKYKLQVFPLFSSEEVYSNEETPATQTILPNRTVYNELSWDETPPVGIFNVVYTVEFEGSTAEVKKMVIKCPVWLLFIIIFAIAAIVIYFVVRAKQRKGATRD